MSDTNKKTKLSMLLLASLISTNLVFASNYKNNVVDVKLNKETNNAVKVTIFTDKPYTEPVVVNKKANNKYVILMPETKSSLKCSPSITNLAGTVSDISVNTQAIEGGKGYTKIVITSDKAITIVPRTQTSAVAPQAKPQVDTQKLAEEKAKQEALAKAQAQKLAQEKAKQEQAKKLAEQKARQEALAKAQAQKLAQIKAQQEQAKKLAEQKAKQEALAKAQAQKTTQETVAHTETTKQPLEILKDEIETDKNANFANNQNDEILNNEINNNLKTIKERNAKKKKKAIVKQFNLDENQSVIDNIKAVIKDYQNINLWKLLLLASAITFPVIVIMLILGMDKKINKRIDASFRKEEDIVETVSSQTYESVQPMQQIADEIQSVQKAVEQVQASTQFNSFEDMLDKVEEPTPTYHEEQLNKTQPVEFEEPVITEYEEPEIITDEEFENDFETEDFEPEFINDELDIPVQEEPVSIIEEEIQLPTVVEPVVQIQEPQETYSPDGYISDFANVNDKDFFDELVLQTMADGNANGLPEESPADEIFNFMQEDFIPQNNMLDDLNINNTEENQIINNTTVVTTTDNNEISKPVADDSLTMLTEVKLNDNTGLYLVNYDNFSSLVGHINDEYFVIKKFDNIVNSGINLKQAEKLKDATRYLVRVGKDKMVLEVTETSMSRLLDL